MKTKISVLAFICIISNLYADNADKADSLLTSDVVNGKLQDGKKIRPIDIIYSPSIGDNNTFPRHNDANITDTLNRKIQSGALPTRRRLEEPNLRKVINGKTIYGEVLKPSYAYKDLAHLQKVKTNLGSLITNSDIRYPELQFSDFGIGGALYVEPNILDKYKGNTDIFDYSYIKSGGDSFFLKQDKINLTDTSGVSVVVEQTLKEGDKQTPLSLTLKNNFYENSVDGSVLSSYQKEQDKIKLKVQENIHKISGLPINKYTGVLDTYIQGDVALSYVLTKDYPSVTSLDYVTDGRKAKGGDDGFRGSKDDITSLGLLNPAFFESSVYKKNDFYQGNIYTTHGDYLTKFVTGFGVAYEKKGSADDFDGGWFSHRFIKDDGNYTDGDYVYPTILGAKYSQYDPITTFIPDDFDSTKIAYKQYAIDDKADADNNFSIHVRSIEAYINTDGKYDGSLIEKYSQPSTTPKGYKLITRFYPDPVDLYSCKPSEPGKHQNLAEMATYADAQAQDPRDDAAYWTSRGYSLNPYDSNFSTLRKYYADASWAGDKAHNTNPRPPHRDFPQSGSTTPGHVANCGFMSCRLGAKSKKENHQFFNDKNEFGVCAGRDVVFVCDRSFSSGFSGSQVNNRNPLLNDAEVIAKTTHNAYNNAKVNIGIDDKRYVYNIGESLGGNGDTVSMNIFKVMYDSRHISSNEKDMRYVAPARKWYSENGIENTQNLELMATLKSAYAGANVSGMKPKHVRLGGNTDVVYLGFNSSVPNSVINVGIDYSSSNPNTESGKAVIYNYQPPMPSKLSANETDGTSISEVLKSNNPQGGWIDNYFAVESTVWRYADNSDNQAAKKIAEALKNINIKLELVADDSCGSRGNNGKYYFIRMTMGGAGQKNYLDELRRSGFTANLYIYGIKDKTTGRIMLIDKEIKVITTSDVEVKDASTGIVSAKNKWDFSDGANTIYDQVSGMVKSGDGDTGGYYRLTMDKLDKNVAQIYRIELQRKNDDGDWERLGDLIDKKYSTWYNNGNLPSDIKLRVARSLEGASAKELSDIKSYNIMFALGDFDEYFLGWADNQGELKSTFKLESLSGYNFGKIGIKYDNGNKEALVEEPGEYKFVIYRMNSVELKAKLDQNGMQSDGYGNPYVNHTADDTKYKTLFKKIIKEIDPKGEPSSGMIPIGEYEFKVRPAFAKIVSVNGSENPSFRANLLNDINLKFKFYKASGVTGKGEQAYSKDMNLGKLSLAYELSRFSGMSRDYLLNQPGKNGTITDTMPIENYDAQAKLKSPYWGEQLKLLGFVGEVSDRCNTLEEHKTTNSKKLENPNIAIDGKYGCFAIPIPIKVDFTADIVRDCKVHNQYAFFRARENSDKDDAMKMAFNISNLYNVDYHCVQSYGYKDNVTNETRVIYSVGGGDCKPDDNCNHELATIKNMDMDIRVDGKKLSVDEIKNSDIKVIIYDQNYKNASNDVVGEAERWCSGIYDPKTKTQDYKDCVDNELKNFSYGMKNSKIEIDGMKGYGDFYNYQNGFTLSASNMNSRMGKSILDELGDSGIRYDYVYYYLDSLAKLGQTDFRPKTYVRDIDLSNDENAYNKKTDDFEVAKTGNIFRVSVSKTRKTPSKPVLIKENISCEPQKCDIPVQDRQDEYDNTATSYLKYGILSPQDIILKDGVGGSDFVTLNSSNSNDPKFFIKVFDTNGEYKELSQDDDFKNSKKVIDENTLQGQIINGYDIRYTSVVDVNFINGVDNIGYEIKGRGNQALYPFKDIGTIISNDNNKIEKILKPTPDTINIIYGQSHDRDWRGVDNKKKN